MSENMMNYLDKRGVGEMLKFAIAKIQASNPKVKISVCGEHAGDPESIRFFHNLGVDYISCSPYRIPIAKVAAAQAQIIAMKRKQIFTFI